MSMNLPIFGIQKGNLKEFATTEKDAKKLISRFPPAQFRLKDEDIVTERETQMVKAEVMDSTWTFMDDYAQNVIIRNQQFVESKNFEENTNDDENDDDESLYEAAP